MTLNPFYMCKNQTILGIVTTDPYPSLNPSELRTFPNMSIKTSGFLNTVHGLS